MLNFSCLPTSHFLPSSSYVLPPLEPIDLPVEYATRADLVRCSLPSLEEEFGHRLPGTIETYRHSRGIVIFRYVNGATRKLHGSAVCLQNCGFKVSAPDAETDAEGRHWQVFTARNAKNRVRVRSTVMELGTSHSWGEEEEWFWHSFFTNSRRGYLAITEINDEVGAGELY